MPSYTCPMKHVRRRVAGLVVVVVSSLAGACGADDDPSAAVETTVSTRPISTTAAPTTAGATGEPLPGERVELYPYEGARLAVVGVSTGDTLKVRAGPGVAFRVVLGLGPLATNAVARGHNRSLGDAGFWSEITVGATTGWANTSFLLQLGEVNDITATLFPTAADRPRSESMLQLARTVGELRTSGEPASRIVIVEGPRLGDLGEVTVDVIGLGDDSVGGERLKIFAVPTPGGGGITLRTVEATTLCSRGVTTERLCV